MRVTDRLNDRHLPNHHLRTYSPLQVFPNQQLPPSLPTHSTPHLQPPTPTNNPPPHKPPSPPLQKTPKPQKPYASKPNPPNPPNLSQQFPQHTTKTVPSTFSVLTVHLHIPCPRVKKKKFLI